MPSRWPRCCTTWDDVGIPDQVLLKPGPLDPDETRIVEQSRKMSVEILRNACADRAILEIVENVGAWFDGSKGGYRCSGSSIPLGARMLAVAEAFDSMTSDHVFRRAMSQERAIQELFRSAGTQFDPGLVQQFVEFQTGDQTAWRRDVAQRWLHSLSPETVNSYWELTTVAAPAVPPETQNLFDARLLDNMHDAVVFVDASMRIHQWNHGAERLTGITASSVCHRPWSPTLVHIQNEKGEWIDDEDCPVACAIHSKVQSLRRLTITGRAGRPVSVDTHAIPVAAGDGTALGAVLLMHDASSEASLEERCQSLHAKATRDSAHPGGQPRRVGSRSRNVRGGPQGTADRLQPDHVRPGPLQAGQRHVRPSGRRRRDPEPGDLAEGLVPARRPGGPLRGEEFVVLCADCDNATAARRAEQVRKRFGQIRHERLQGGTVTASFGVTEIQPGDTAATMLRRVDRALLLAKQKGRNAVVQLGIGSEGDKPERPSGWWRGKASEPALVLQQNLVTPVPVSVVVEKLRGFVADHRATIVKIDSNQVDLQIEDRCQGRVQRASDRPIGFSIHLEFVEEGLEKPEVAARAPTAASWTRIHVAVRPQRDRDRRRSGAAEQAREVLISLRSYLMATEEDPPSHGGVLRRSVRFLVPWLLKP